jgi:hypothetical protein
MKIGDIEDGGVKRLAIELASTPSAREWRELSRKEERVEYLDLSHAFDWGSTNQGYEYWRSIAVSEEEEPSQRDVVPALTEEDQINPKHYKDNLFGKELQYVIIDIFGEEEYKIFSKINAFKYRMRAGKKTDKIEQEIGKAMWYEEKLKSI